MSNRSSSTTSRALWTCPKCRRQFINRDMPHSCGRYTVEKFLAGKSSDAIALYRRFSALVNQCGSVKLAPAKTRIGFQVRMIFAAVNKLNDRGLEAHIVLARRINNPRFKRIETMSPKCHVHHFRIEAPSDLDQEVAGWLCEAYQVGTQQHLWRRRVSTK